MADPKQLLVNLPGAGRTQAYQLSADTPVQFGFDLAEAVFTGNNGNLEIYIEGGGTVVLEGYQALAEAGDLPAFEMMSGEVIASDVYLFAFADQDATAEDLETAAGANTGSSGAGQYNDDPGTLFAGLNALDGQGDAFGGEALAAAADTAENTPPQAYPDVNEVTEQGDVDLYVNLEDPASHIQQVQSQTVTFFAEEQPYDGGEDNPGPRVLTAMSLSGDNVGSIDPDTGEIYVESLGMTISAHSNTPGDDDALTIGDDGLGVDNNGSAWGDNPAIDDKMGSDWVQVDFDDPQGYVKIVLGDFNEGYEFTDDATITLYGANGVIGVFHMGQFDGGTFEYTVKASDDLITEIRVSAGGGFHDIVHNDFYIESITATAVPEGDFFPTDDNGNGFIINYPEGEHSFQDVTGNVIDNDFDAENPDQLTMHTIDFLGENHDGIDEASVLMTADGTEVMGKYGILTIDMNGDYTYSLNPDWADSLEEGQVVEEVFQYSIADPLNAVSNLTTLTITVYGTNDAPVAVHDYNDQAIEQGDSTAYDLPDGYSDGDDGGEVPDLKPSFVGEGNGDYPQGDTELHDYTEMVAATGNVLLNDSDVDDLDFTDPDNPETPEVEGDFSTLFVVGVYSNESMEYDWVQPGEGGTPYSDVPTEDGQVLDVATIADTEMIIAGKYGHLTIGTDGSYTYTPDIGENVAPLNYDTPGFETFSYAIMDDSGAFSYQSITFKVNGANDAPDVEADNNYIIEFGADWVPNPHYAPWVFGNVLSNDSDVDDSYIYVEKITSGDTTQDIGEGGFTIIQGQYGTLKIWSNGHYKYTLDQENEDVQGLDQNEDGSRQTLDEVFTYSATNSWDDGVSSQTTLTITIKGSNDAPVAVDDHVTLTDTEVYSFDAANAVVAAGHQSAYMDGITVTAFVDNDDRPWTAGNDFNPDLTLNTVEGHTGFGINSYGDMLDGEVDSRTWSAYDEQLVISLDSPKDTVTIELAALFANSGYDGGHTEQAMATAWGYNDGHLVKLGSVIVDGDSDGLVEFTMSGYPYDIDRVVLTSVDNGQGQTADNSDFTLVSVTASSTDGIYEGQSEPVVIKIADLLANDYDVDYDDTVAFDGIVPGSEQGGYAEVHGDEIWFYVDEDTNMNNGDTLFEYQITDGDEIATATVTMDVLPTNDDPVAVSDMNHGVMLTEATPYVAGEAYATIDFSDWTPAHLYHGPFWNPHKYDDGDGDNTWWQDADLQDVTVWARNGNALLGEHLVQDSQDGNLGVDTTTWPIDVVFDTTEVNSGNTYSEEIVIDFGDGRGEVTVLLGSLVGDETATVTAYNADGEAIAWGTATSGDPEVTLTSTGDVIARVVLSPDGDSSFTLARLDSRAPGTQHDVTSSGSVHGNVLTNDYDVDMYDAGSTETMVASLLSSPAGLFGDLIFNADGSYTYTPDETKIDALNDTYVETFEYQIVDSHGAVDTATLYIPLHYEDLNEINGTMGTDHLVGTSGDDIITGYRGGDLIEGNAGDDVLIGNRGADTLNGGEGDDIIFGDKGDDIILVSSGHDIVTLGEGADTIRIDPANIIIDDGLDNDASTITVIDFKTADGDSFSLDSSLVGTHVDITSNDSDITLFFSDLNHDGDATTNDTLQVVLSGVDPANNSFSDHVEITNSDDLNQLIQQIIDSPDNT